MAFTSQQHMLPCTRCGSNITISNPVTFMDSFAVYCQSCTAIMSQEMVSLQKQVEKLLQENRNLKAKQDTFDDQISKAKSRADSIEKAYSDEAQERLQIRAERDWARNAILFWKSFLDHQKVAKTCPYCSKFEPCPALKEIEAQATSTTPQWKCPNCEEKESTMAMMMKSIHAAKDFLNHEEKCSKCGNAICDFGKELYRGASKAVHNGLMNGGGERLLRRMDQMVGDFSFLGDNTALFYSKGKYQVIKIDPRKIMTGDVILMSTAENPRASIDMAKRQQETMATVHHA